MRWDFEGVELFGWIDSNDDGLLVDSEKTLLAVRTGATVVDNYNELIGDVVDTWWAEGNQYGSIRVGDGKIRGSELATLWNFNNGGFRNLFDIRTQLGFKVNAFVDIKRLFGSGYLRLLDITLLDVVLFDKIFRAPDVSPVLAEKVGTILYLNSGSDRAREKETL